MQPVRTCLGCRGRENKADLIRLVSSSGGIAVDVRQVAPGRGGYLHPRPECWEQALNRRALTRALRAGDVDGELLLSELQEVVRDCGGA